MKQSCDKQKRATMDGFPFALHFFHFVREKGDFNGLRRLLEAV